MLDQDHDTRVGYVASTFFELVQTQKELNTPFEGLDEARRWSMSTGAVRANRLQFGMRLLIGEDSPALQGGGW